MKKGGLKQAGKRVDREQRKKQEFFRQLEMQDDEMLRGSINNDLLAKNSVVHLISAEIDKDEENDSNLKEKI